MWGTLADWGAGAGPLRRGRKGSKLTLGEGKVCLVLFVPGEGPGTPGLVLGVAGGRAAGGA